MAQLSAAITINIIKGLGIRDQGLGVRKYESQKLGRECLSIREQRKREDGPVKWSEASGFIHGEKKENLIQAA